MLSHFLLGTVGISTHAFTLNENIFLSSYSIIPSSAQLDPSQSSRNCFSQKKKIELIVNFCSLLYYTNVETTSMMKEKTSSSSLDYKKVIRQLSSPSNLNTNIDKTTSNAFIVKATALKLKLCYLGFFLRLCHCY